jgi:hypothetical protein
LKEVLPVLSLELFESMDTALKVSRTNELLALNEELKEHGLRLTPTNIEEILTSRNLALKNQGRIELDISLTKKLVDRLSRSAYIRQENFVKTIDEIYEVFHYVKNATSDFISDDDLLGAIMVYYEKICGGSIELLIGKGLDKIINNFKQQRQLTDIDKREDEKYWNIDE